MYLSLAESMYKHILTAITGGEASGKKQQRTENIHLSGVLIKRDIISFAHL